MILVDTSAWIEYERATGSPAHQRLHALVADADEVAVTEPVMAEFVMRAREERQELFLRRLLAPYAVLSFDVLRDFDGAVWVYRRCRKAGVTPRGLLDCMIAAVALRHGLPVLAHDADFARISDVVALELDKASFRPAAARAREAAGQSEASPAASR